MRLPSALIAIAFFGAPLAAAAAGQSFVQATVVGSDAARGTLSFVDASGKSRSHTVTGAASSRFARLRAGDEVILVLSGDPQSVEDIRVSRLATASASSAAATPDTAVDPAADQTQWTVVPAQQMRPTWPNPYSRYFKGPRPARR
jgi:hypothetical protein